MVLSFLMKANRLILTVVSAEEAARREKEARLAEEESPLALAALPL
jgi:hypothetical protein